MPNDPKLKSPYRQNGVQKFIMFLIVTVLFVAGTAVLDNRPPDFELVGKSLLFLYAVWWLSGRIIDWMNDGPDHLFSIVRTGSGQLLAGTVGKPLLRVVAFSAAGAFALYFLGYELGILPIGKALLNIIILAVAVIPAATALALLVIGWVWRALKRDPGGDARPATNPFSFDASRFHGFRSRPRDDKRPIFQPLMIEHRVDLSSERDAEAFAEGLRRSMDEELIARMEAESESRTLSEAERGFLRRVLAALRGKSGERKQIAGSAQKRITGP